MRGRDGGGAHAEPASVRDGRGALHAEPARVSGTVEEEATEAEAMKEADDERCFDP